MWSGKLGESPPSPDSAPTTEEQWETEVRESASVVLRSVPPGELCKPYSFGNGGITYDCLGIM